MTTAFLGNSDCGFLTEFLQGAFISDLIRGEESHRLERILDRYLVVPTAPPKARAPWKRRVNTRDLIAIAKFFV